MEQGVELVDRGARPGLGVTFDLDRGRAWSDAVVRSSAQEVHRLANELARWMDTFYVGLDSVRRRGCDPVAALRSARSLEDVQQVFTALGDRHTSVSMQAPMNRLPNGGSFETVGLLHLPVQIGMARGENGSSQETFWISEVSLEAQASADANPRVGDEVTHWNGVRLGTTVRRLGRKLRGAHSAARTRLGLRALTRRVFEPGNMPEEDWVVLTCRRDDRLVHHRLHWSAHIPTWPKRRGVREPDGDCDRIALGHFGAPEEMRELLEELAAQRRSGRPLLLDLRGNAGGSVHGMLAAFEAITGRCGASRLRFQFRASQRLAGDLSRFRDWRQWARSAQGGYFAPHRLEQTESEGSVDRMADRTERGPRFEGRRVAVLADASTFSAAEILTALLRAEGALLLGTDDCLGGGADNGWSVAALRRLCPERWIEIGRDDDPEGAVREHCASERLHVTAGWTESGVKHWRLREAGDELGGPTWLAVWNGHVAPEHIAIYGLQTSLGKPAGLRVDLQMSVRRPLVRRDGEWVSVECQRVDHVLTQTRRDLLEDEVDLMEKAFRILAGDVRVARSGPETPAPTAA